MKGAVRGIAKEMKRFFLPNKKKKTLTRYEKKKSAFSTYKKNKK